MRPRTLTGASGSQINQERFSQPFPLPRNPDGCYATHPNTLASFAASLGTPSVSYFPSDTRLPAAEEFDLVLEHELWRNTSVSVSYLGSVGRFLPIGMDTNLNPSSGVIPYVVSGGPLNGKTVDEPLFTGTRPNTNYNHIVMYCSCATSYYNAMVLQFNRRETNGLQYNLSYTYASNTDDDTASAHRDNRQRRHGHISRGHQQRPGQSRQPR